MTTISVGTGHLALLDTELLGKSLLQTGAVEGGEGGELLRLQSGTDKSGEGGDISRVEDDHDELHVRAILLDVLSELSGDLAVALEKILTGHALLTGSSTRGNDVLGILEGDSGINGGGDVHTRESAMIHLSEDSEETGLKDVVKADVRGKLKHGGGLGHVRSDHSGGADDDQFVICQKSHFYKMFYKYFLYWAHKDSNFPQIK